MIAALLTLVSLASVGAAVLLAFWAGRLYQAGVQVDRQREGVHAAPVRR